MYNVMLISAAQQWFSYTHTYSFLYSFPLWFITGSWILFLVLRSKTFLFIHPIYNSLHLLIPNTESVLPAPSFPLGTTICSLCLCICFCFCRYIPSGSYFRFHILSDIIWHLSFSFWLTSLSISVIIALFHSFLYPCIPWYIYIYTTSSLSIYLLMDI